MRKIIFQAEIENKQAQKQLDKLNKQIAKTEDQLNAQSDKRSSIEAQMDKANAAVDKTRDNLRRMQDELAAKKGTGVNTSALEARISGKKAELSENVRNAESLGKQYLKADEAVQKLTADLQQQQAAAGKLEQKVSQTYNPAKLKEAAASVQASLKGGFKTILKYAFGIRSIYILFRKLRSVVTEGIKEFAKYDSTTNKALSNLKNGASNLKASFVSMFVPLLQVIEPIITRIMNALSKLVDYVGMFFAALRGETTYKKAIAAESDYAASLKQTGKEAKKTAQYLTSLDEIRTYDTNKDSDTASGSGSGSFTGVKEVAIPKNLQTVASKLRIGFDSIEMLYNNIKPAQVEEVFKALFAGLVGASFLGIVLGPAGLVGGFLIGVGLYMLFKSLEQLSSNITSDQVSSVVGGLLAGLVGAAFLGLVLGPAGFVGGFVLGIGLYMLFNSLKQLSSNINPDKVTSILKTLFAGLVGAAFLGLILGPAGFVGGFVLGIGLYMLFNSLKQLSSNINPEKITNILKTLFAGLVGAAFLGLVLGPAGLIGGFVLGIGLYMLFKSLQGSSAIKTKSFFDILSDIFKKTAGLSFLSVIPGAQGLISIYFTLRSVLKLFFGDKDVQVDEDDTVAGKVDKFGEDITGQMEQVGEDTEEGFWTGFQKRADSSKKVSPLGRFINSIIDMFRGKDGFDCHSPSKVMAGIGENVVDGLMQGFQSAWTKIKIMMSLVQHAADQMRSMFNFEWSLPRIKLPHFYWDWVQVGNLLSLPRISVQWYAKGGIVDKPTILGAGEAGKEAIVPLERNTEWIRRVADELADILTDRLGSILQSYPMPAVANGALIPPRIEVDIDGLDAIDSKLAAILDRMGNRGGSYSFTAQLNRKTLFSEMISEAKIQQSTTGRNPFELR